MEKLKNRFVILAKAGIQTQTTNKKTKKVILAFVKHPCVYIMASDINGTLYIGVTSNLLKRVYEHKEHTITGFTQRHAVIKLVYFEHCDDMYTAITREKQLKKWKRDWKIRLISEKNPSWKDLYNDLL